jgi:hypothetical protein
MMPEMADAFLAIPALAHVRFGEWDLILTLPEPPQPMMASRATWRYARTMALLARGNRAGAERERRDFDELREKIPADASWGQNKARSVLEMASAILSARLAGAPKRSREALGARRQLAGQLRS